MTAPVSVARELVAAAGELASTIVTTAQGLLVTARYLVDPKEIVTFRYPRETLAVLPNARGRLMNDVVRCIACGICARTCPAACIVVETEAGADKKPILKSYRIDMTKCLYCGLCAEACPDSTKNDRGEKCLTMSGGFAYSSDRKETIAFLYEATDAELAAKRAAAAERAAKAAAAQAAKAAAAKKASSAPAVGRAPASAPAVRKPEGAA